MKKIIITILLQCSVFGVFAQCKSKKDAISGIETKESGRVIIFSKGSFEGFDLFYTKQNDEYTMHYLIYLEGSQKDIISANTEIILKLQNNDILKLLTTQDFASKVSVFSNRLVSTYELNLNVSKENMKKISNSPPVAISTLNITSFKGNACEIKEKAGKKISTIASCILQ